MTFHIPGTRTIFAVHPWSLITVPEHATGLSHVVAMVHVLRTVASS